MKAIYDRYDEIVELSTLISKGKGNPHEIAHEALLKLVKIPKETIDNVIENNKFREYAGKTIWNMVYGKHGAYKKIAPTSSYELRETDSPIVSINPMLLYREQVEVYARRLPKREKILFDAHIEKGIPIKEISRCTDIPLSSCYRIINRSKQRIADAIAQQCSVC